MDGRRNGMGIMNWRRCSPFLNLIYWNWQELYRAERKHQTRVPKTKCMVKTCMLNQNADKSLQMKQLKSWCRKDPYGTEQEKIRTWDYLVRKSGKTKHEKETIMMMGWESPAKHPREESCKKALDKENNEASFMLERKKKHAINSRCCKRKGL